MNCPNCDHSKVKTLSTRAADGNVTRRRKVCKACGHRFTSFEFVKSDAVDQNITIKAHRGANLGPTYFIEKEK